jgi:hypothetical protein
VEVVEEVTSEFQKIPTSASEQTAKLCSGRPLSYVHSMRDCERRFNDGKRKSLFFPAISSAIQSTGD